MFTCQITETSSTKYGQLLELPRPLVVKLVIRYAIRQINTINVQTICDKNTIDIHTVYEQNDHEYVIGTV